MRVLHAIDVYLRVSENWVYPQIHHIPGVTPAVICRAVENLDQFPARDTPLFLDPPPWHQGFGIPRLINSIAFRAGFPLFAAGFAARRWKPDILHAHFGMRGWELLPLKAKTGAPLVTSFYGVDAWALPERSALWRDRYRELFEHGDIFIAEGPAMGKRLADIGCDPRKIRVVRIGVKPGEPLPESRIPGVSRVLMMARFMEKKGLPDGLRACREARALGADLTVTIVGDAVPGDAAGQRIRTELREIASVPELKDRVEFKGFLPAAESREIMRSHDIYLCPSVHARDGDAEGGSPVSLTEAMGLGLLCIGTRHCDIPEVILAGETGWLAESGDVKSLASMLAAAISDPEQTRRIRRRGRAHVISNFSTAAQTESLGNIYAALYASKMEGDAPSSPK